MEEIYLIEGDTINYSMKQKKEMAIIIVNYIILCIAIVILMFAYKLSGKNTYIKNATEIAEGWVDSNGEKVELDELNFKEDDKIDIKYTLKNKDISNNKNNSMIVFLASNCYVDTYIDGKIIDKDDRNNIKYMGVSPGRRWHLLNVPSSHNKQEIVLKIDDAYKDSYGRIDNIYIGTPSGVIKQILKDKLSGFLISFLLVIVGILMCILFIFVKYSNKHKKIKNMEWNSRTVLYLGVLTICMGLYSSMETYFWQFMLGYSYIFQIVSYIAVFFIGILIGLIGREILTQKKRILANIVYWLSIVFFVTATILNFTGVLEYHYIMRYIYIYGALLSIIVFFEGYTYIKEKEIISSMLLFGVCLFSVTFACDCIRYLFEGANDICAYTRIGFLVLVICIFALCVESVVKMMQKGLYADLYKQMANTDPLTNLYNRNALILDEKMLNELIKKDNTVGIAMFDVNELKYVNDTFGHEQGDILIKTAADLIKEAFGEFGKCYRIGGDEFVSVFTHSDVETVYKEALQTFLDNIKKHNEDEKNEHKIQIAYGFYFSNTELVDEIWQKADELMYEKKKQMKN